MSENPNTKRSREYRKRLKQSPEKLQAFRENEKLRRQTTRGNATKKKNLDACRRQQKCRERKKAAAFESNKRKKIRDRNTRLQHSKAAKMADKIQDLSNKNRRLMRQIKMLSSSDTIDCSDDDISKTGLIEQQSPAVTLLYNTLSPRTKKKAIKQLQNSNDSKKNCSILRKAGLRIDRMTEVFGDGTIVQKNVTEFMIREDNVSICPDAKKEGILYRLGTLKVLYEKYCSEYDNSCSYSWFCKNIPKNIIKPKPEDWGTCLCKPCINTELKLEAARKIYAEFKCDIENIETRECVKNLINGLKEKCKSGNLLNNRIEFLEWTNESEDSENKDGTLKKSHYSRRKIISCTVKKYLALLETDLNIYTDHISTAIAQYRRIKQVKLDIKTNATKVMIRLDWSENLTLFQPRQEKGAYYTDIQISLHPMIIYKHSGLGDDLEVLSYAGISDCTIHRAPATWVTLQKVLNELESTVSDITIVSDSPFTQYRNKFMIWFIAKYAEDYNKTITWIFTESGHGKGPADGVGASVKNTVSNDIIALNPNKVISDCSTILELWPNSSFIMLLVYTKEDIDSSRAQIPHEIIKGRLQSKNFGIGKSHEVICNPIGEIYLKLNSSTDAAKASFKCSTMQKKTFCKYSGYCR